MPHTARLNGPIVRLTASVRTFRSKTFERRLAAMIEDVFIFRDQACRAATQGDAYLAAELSRRATETMMKAHPSLPGWV